MFPSVFLFNIFFFGIFLSFYENGYIIKGTVFPSQPSLEYTNLHEEEAFLYLKPSHVCFHCGNREHTSVYGEEHVSFQPITLLPSQEETTVPSDIFFRDSIYISKHLLIKKYK